MNAQERLQRFRHHKDEYFKEGEHSPLLPEQQEAFSGLDYFPYNEALDFTVEIDDEGVDDEQITLGTTTGEPADVIRAGRIHVVIDDEPISLTVFREVGRGRFFLPFRDLTSGVETYGVGRYIDPQERPDGRIHVDFNYAYNPYCAYNDRWVCPIPPAENQLTVAVRAGERAFPGAYEEAPKFSLRR
jgi:uncharacterized protein (DUF1684 family)